MVEEVPASCNPYKRLAPDADSLVLCRRLLLHQQHVEISGPEALEEIEREITAHLQRH